MRSRFFHVVAALAGSAIAFLPSVALAQTLPPIFDNVPIDLATHQQIATFPVNTFLENVVVNAEGTLFITNHEVGEIIQIPLNGTPSVFATISGKVSGLVFTPVGELLVTGWTKENVPVVSKVLADGTVTTLALLPDAIFLNGITHLSGDRYLIADSYRGAIWELDATQGSSRLWLEHPLLSRRSDQSPIPGVNGIKRFGDTLYVSNSDRMILLQIPISPEGTAGTPTLTVDEVNLDDFAFDVDGNLYGATHIYNSVVRISPDGAITTIAQSDQGMTGSTAIAFGRGMGDRTAIYVVTNGGMFLPPPTGVLPAEVVRLDVGQEGMK